MTKKIDLTTCIPGQKLILRNGTKYTYVSNQSAEKAEPHIVKNENGQEYTRPDNGKFAWYRRGQDSLDVVEIIPITLAEKQIEPEVVQANVEQPLKILLKKRNNKYQFKIISQPESFRCPEKADAINFSVSNGFVFYSCEYPNIPESRNAVYLRGDDYDRDNDSQLVALTAGQANTIRESVKLFNEEYPDYLISQSYENNQTLEEITAEYIAAQDAAITIYKEKINKLLAAKASGSHNSQR